MLLLEVQVFLFNPLCISPENVSTSMQRAAGKIPLSSIKFVLLWQFQVKIPSIVVGDLRIGAFNSVRSRRLWQHCERDASVLCVPSRASLPRRSSCYVVTWCMCACARRVLRGETGLASFANTADKEHLTMICVGLRSFLLTSHPLSS
ncbi:hypothetical protein QTP88_005732 [Uroleucon formosanum]